MLLILMGRSGSGKNAIAKALIRNHNYKKVATCTTRDRRPGETDEDYHFMSTEEFGGRCGRGEFAEFDSYGGNLYGTLKSSLVSEDKLVIIMTPQGAQEIKKIYPEACIVNLKVDTKTAFVRAVMREENLSPGKINAISSRAIADCSIFADPYYDIEVENSPGANLNDVARRIDEDFDRYAISSALKGTTGLLKDLRTELEDSGKVDQA